MNGAIMALAKGKGKGKGAAKGDSKAEGTSPKSAGKGGDWNLLSVRCVWPPESPM